MNNVKVWLTCPESHADIVRLAIGDAGLGVIGNYTHCSFVSKGTGYFKPNQEANPAVGVKNEINSVAEVVIEFVCFEHELIKLKTVLKEVHPYEEPAVDVSLLLDF
jgi:hypothetical protein